jgi:hypothetical protein
VKATPTAGPRALGGRTHVLSQIEVAIALLHMPAFHQLAATLPFKKDGEDVNGHRDRGYPKAIVLLLGTMARKCRSLPRAEAFLRNDAMWEVIRTHWRAVKLEGIADPSEPDVLIFQPIRAGQWRYAVEQIKDDPTAFPLFESVFLESSVALAQELGYFSRGSISHPHITSCLFADGTELRSQYRSYPDLREDLATGEIRLAAVDPQIKANGGVRAWLDQDPLTGVWRAVDPKTEKRLKKVPVDIDALASGKYGPTQAAYNIVPMSVRDDTEHSRITLTVGADATENTEAATILAAVERIDGTSLKGKVQALITDMIIRGAHGVTLMTRYGVVPLTKVAAAAVEDGAPEGAKAIDVIVFTGRDGVTRTKTAKTYSLGMRSHTLASGAECKHIFHRVDGAMIEVDFNQDGTAFVEVGRPVQFQVKRSGRITNGRRYHFNEGFHVTCPHGDFDIWCCPHEPHGDDDGRHVAENSRIFPEGGEIFRGLYGAGRNTSEGGNAHHKDTYPHKRSQASGRVPVLLDAYLYYLIDNATTWYFQVGWASVDEILPQPVDNIVKLAA